MSNRREFLKEVAGAAAGVVFTGCGLLDAQQSAKSAGAPKRRQVMVGGRRVRTIDIHAHVVVPEATALMGRKTEANNAAIMAGEMATERFARMDEWGTDMRPSASIPPGIRSSATWSAK